MGPGGMWWKNPRIVTLLNANHSVFADQQEAVDRILAEFLA